MVIDTHAHLMFGEFEGDVEGAILRAKEAGVSRIINVGCGVESSQKSVEMAAKYPELFATLGIHPYDAIDVNEELMGKWELLINDNKKIVAIGECGLDYVKAEVSKEQQMLAFRLQATLAKKTGLPLIVHNRGADEDCLKILDEVIETGEGPLNVVFHCYSSDVSFARKLWYRGFMISFTATITYPTAVDALVVVDEMPMDSFMVETDCPYLAPQEYRGQRNEPAYVLEVIKKIAEVKEIPADQVARIATENAEGFFWRMG
jgi:TatD DNase family protein